jgi:DNA-binding NtrC family response regulator
MSGEVTALPILLLRQAEAGPISVEILKAWSALGSVRWGTVSDDTPLPGLRPSALDRPSLTATQALGLGFVGIGSAMQDVLAKARAAAATRATVLLTGESGTGKEVVSKAIHKMSAQANGPFVAVHCGAIPENLIESELFGYTKGAFTDARKDTLGKFREAHEGTIFLDEVATMPFGAQVRLLRVLQEREVQPLGGGGPVKVEVRVIVATNQDLWKKVQEGHFREDLFYRLDVVPIFIPPLRERREEIPYLAQHFLNRKAKEHGLYPKALHPSVDPLLSALPWPGNVRQLENAIESAIVLSGTRPVLTRDDFKFILDRVPDSEAILSELPPPPQFYEPAYANAGPAYELSPDGIELNHVVAELEKKLILEALSVTRGNKKRAAEMLGIKRTTLLEKIKRLGILSEDDPLADSD